MRRVVSAFTTMNDHGFHSIPLLIGSAVILLSHSKRESVRIFRGLMRGLRPFPGLKLLFISRRLIGLGTVAPITACMRIPFPRQEVLPETARSQANGRDYQIKEDG